jgi:4-amino-4-deoxy-L-arabinose transferase-like glycosyltransferase
MTLPWMPFFLAAMWRAGRDIIHRIASPIVLFAVSWLVVPILFFTFSGSKLPGYIVPAVPAAIVITALLVFEFGQQSRKWRTAVLAIAATTLAVAIGFLIFALPGFADRDSVKALVQAADKKGYASSRILTLHMVSYNAEYYATGRLLRDEKGGQGRLEGAMQVLTEANKESGLTVLVLVPVEYVSQLTEYDKVTSDVIKDNGEVAIVAVAAK